MSELVIGTQSVILAYKYRDLTLPIFKKFKTRVLEGELKICILGMGGTGKSALGAYLSDMSKPDGQSSSIERGNYKGSLYGQITVSPVQTSYRAQWDKTQIQHPSAAGGGITPFAN